ncbi:MAG: ABC transporter permease, partial [Candidatus Bipolaricaulota bacterium]
VSGDSYKFLGLFETDLHLFGTGTDQAPIFLFGSDGLGRDLFSRVIWGSRVSMTIGPLGIIISFTLGIFFGGISGYFGGTFDMSIQRFTEVVMSFPQLPLWLALRASFPDTWSSVITYMVMVVILAFVNWAKVARVIRGQFLSLKEKEFSTAAKAVGCSNARIIFRHILPGTTSYLIVAATVAVPGYILGESSLSFLGLGIREPMASWGLLLRDAQSITNLESHPWLMIPGVFIIIAVLAFNFMGDALRDAVDPFAEV